MKEFLGFGGYSRPAEGFLSWQHLLFVGILLSAMVLLALYFGRKYRNCAPAKKNNVMVVAAILIDAFELFKIVVLCLRSQSAEALLYNLPLFLCSIQLIAIPLAAFTGGRTKAAALDFVCIFGLLGAVFGTIGAGQNYNAYPVLSLDNVVSGITHSISGFASLYIMSAKMASLKRENVWISFCILLAFCGAAYIANILLPYNYMFLMAGDGTPYDILYNWVNGNEVLYPLSVVGLFLVYISLFYYLVYVFRKRAKNKAISAAK